MAMLPMFVSALAALFIFFAARALAEFLNMGAEYEWFVTLSNVFTVLSWSSLLLPAIAFVALSTTVKGSKERGRAVVVSFAASALFTILLTLSVLVSMLLVRNIVMADMEAAASREKAPQLLFMR